MAAFQPALASFQYDAFPLVIIAILTPDRLLLPIAPRIFVVSACSWASLNADEPTIALAPAAADVEDAELAAVLAAELAALLAGVLAAVDELLLDGEEQAASASAPAATAIPAAIFLFIHSPCSWLGWGATDIVVTASPMVLYLSFFWALLRT
jgi:hypothetical protein